MLWKTIITVDARIYPVHVAYKAAYALASTLSILVEQNTEGLALHVSPADPAAMPTEAAGRALVIRNLNDFAMRERIHAETSGIRELLARTALREAGI